MPEKFCYAIPAIPKPSIPGFDVSGIVETIGAGVSEFREGDAVYGMVRFPQGGRGYAEYTTVPMSEKLFCASWNKVAAPACDVSASTGMALMTDGNNVS